MPPAQFKNLITLHELSTSQIEALLHLAAREKKRFKAEGPTDALKGRTSVLIFEKPSLRTRVTFDVALAQTGGSTVNLEPNSISLGKRESVQDGAKNLSRWVDVIVARTFKHALVKELSEHATIPVINALTDLYHPCQALAFAQTLQEKRGDLKGSHLVFVGDGNNVANSLAVLAGKLGMDFTLSCPEGYEQPAEVVDILEPLFQQSGAKYRIIKSPREAVAGADAIYTDVWVSMGEESIRESKMKRFADFQVNRQLMEAAPRGCLVTHCLPAHREEEITSEVLDSEACICFDEAENRLHAQKAVLLALLNPDYSID